jgi:hypothetical protein
MSLRQDSFCIDEIDYKVCRKWKIVGFMKGSLDLNPERKVDIKDKEEMRGWYVYMSLNYFMNKWKENKPLLEHWFCSLVSAFIG